MRRTYLIQRLRAPIERKGEFKPNPFSFGGGFINGGLSNEAMEILSQIFEFDYMGAAEFEFGAIPKSLDHIAQNAKDYAYHTITINKTPVYIIAKVSELDEIEPLLNEIARRKVRLKEFSGFNLAVGKVPKYYGEDFVNTYLGWLELNNHFLFFVDETMATQMANLFNIIAED